MHVCSKSQKDHTPSEDIILPEYSFIFWPLYCIYRLSYTYPIHGRWFYTFPVQERSSLNLNLSLWLSGCYIPQKICMQEFVFNS